MKRFNYDYIIRVNRFDKKLMTVQPKFILDNSLKNWITGTYWNNRKKGKYHQNEEYNWSLLYHSSNTISQWTNSFGENLVFFLLTRLGENCWKPRTRNNFRLDIETDKYIVEVKTRNWSVTGTAGDKIYYTPIKYHTLPIVYNKPLLIILVGYQEYEAIHKFQLWNNNHIGNRLFLEMCRKQHIFYLGASNLITKDVDINSLLKFQ